MQKFFYILIFLHDDQLQNSKIFLIIRFIKVNICAWLYINRLHFNRAMIYIVVFIKFIQLHFLWYSGHVFVGFVLSLIYCKIHYLYVTIFYLFCNLTHLRFSLLNLLVNFISTKSAPHICNCLQQTKGFQTKVLNG